VTWQGNTPRGGGGTVQKHDAGVAYPQKKNVKSTRKKKKIDFPNKGPLIQGGEPDCPKFQG